MPKHGDQLQPLLLVLASSSPRRAELLARLGLKFEVLTADLDEQPHSREDPCLYVERLAREKAAAVARHRPTALVLAADTSVILDGEILGKPQNDQHGRQMLERLSGRSHTVLTGVALAGAAEASQVVATTVHFHPLTSAQIAWYLTTGEPKDKAGGYAVQGIGGAWVRALEGSPSNVIGLPLVETLQLLSAAGFALPWERSCPRSRSASRRSAHGSPLPAPERDAHRGAWS